MSAARGEVGDGGRWGGAPRMRGGRRTALGGRGRGMRGDADRGAVCGGRQRQVFESAAGRGR